MILLATHEIEVAKQMSCLLEAKGYPVILASQGAEVPTLASQRNPRLIVLNLYLRNPSGLEVLRELCAQGYGGKIILLASYSTCTEIPRTFFLGVDQVLEYPLALNHLVSAVRVAIGPAVNIQDDVERWNASYPLSAQRP